jgi:hypothetical protein
VILCSVYIQISILILQNRKFVVIEGEFHSLDVRFCEISIEISIHFGYKPSKESLGKESLGNLMKRDDESVLTL